MKPLRLLVVLALLAGSAALALAAPVAPVTPLPAPLPSVGQQGAVALVPSSTCPLLYSNTANLSGYYFPAGAGVESTAGGVRFTREVFASAPDQAIVMRLTADKPGQVSFTASRLWASSPKASVDGFCSRSGG